VRRRESYIQNGGNAAKMALDGTVQTRELEPNPGNLWDLVLFFVDTQDNIASILLDALEKYTGIKCFLILYVNFIKYNEQNETMYVEPTLRSQNMTLTNGVNIEEEIATVLRKLNNDFQNLETDGRRMEH
jgi:tRNA uridine 5-carbamoylmethylation protein Kti12